MFHRPLLPIVIALALLAGAYEGALAQRGNASLADYQHLHFYRKLVDKYCKEIEEEKKKITEADQRLSIARVNAGIVIGQLRVMEKAGTATEVLFVDGKAIGFETSGYRKLRERLSRWSGRMSRARAEIRAAKSEISFAENRKKTAKEDAARTEELIKKKRDPGRAAKANRKLAKDTKYIGEKLNSGKKKLRGVERDQRQLDAEIAVVREAVEVLRKR